MTSLNPHPELPISFYLLKQCKLWIWDFDDTLIDASTYLKKNMTPDAILKRCDAELDQEVLQWRYFRKLVEFLVSHGRYVGIASFGTYEIIQAYMKRIMGFNQQFFTKKNIIAPCFQYRDVNRFSLPPNKNEYIYNIMRIYRIQDFKRVVLFDDKPSNIADAIAIGVVGIQIATPNNGDNPAASGKMFFGPWVMDEFDKKIQTTCGDEIYLNKTFTSIAQKETYTGTTAFNDPPKTDINFGTGVRAKDGYYMEEYDFTLGVNDKVNSLYNKSTPAFGTGIGDRKVLGQPQFRWNAYKNGSKTSKWYNGNYVNVPDLVKTDGYWDDTGLYGSTLSFWDVHQKALQDNPPTEPYAGSKYIIPQKDNSINEIDTSLPISGISEGFTTQEPNDCGCRKFEWNWIILLLILLIVVMMVIVMRC